MSEQFARTELLLGTEAINRLSECRVAVFGVGGVGGYVCEALVRSGIGHFDLIDSDTVAESNLNRQIIALNSTVGKYKVDVMKERMLDINPNVTVNAHRCFYLPENADDFDFSKYDYVIDAVDTVTAKIEIIMRSKSLGIPVISAMGAGNKLDPSKFKVADIYDTKVCPLCRVMRRELKKRNIENLKVVYSEEEPLKPMYRETNEASENTSNYEVTHETGKTADDVKKPAKSTGGFKKVAPGSSAFCPAACGLVIASEVVRDLIS